MFADQYLNLSQSSQIKAHEERQLPFKRKWANSLTLGSLFHSTQSGDLCCQRNTFQHSPSPASNMRACLLSESLVHLYPDDIMSQMGSKAPADMESACSDRKPSDGKDAPGTRSVSLSCWRTSSCAGCHVWPV